LSTDAVHPAIPLAGRDPAVFPVVHTPYYYDDLLL